LSKGDKGAEHKTILNDPIYENLKNIFLIIYLNGNEYERASMDISAFIR